MNQTANTYALGTDEHDMQRRKLCRWASTLMHSKARG